MTDSLQRVLGQLSRRWDYAEVFFVLHARGFGFLYLAGNRLGRGARSAYGT